MSESTLGGRNSPTDPYDPKTEKIIRWLSFLVITVIAISFLYYILTERAFPNNELLSKHNLNGKGGVSATFSYFCKLRGTDEVKVIPLGGIDQECTCQASKKPLEGEYFTCFLLEPRIYQLQSIDYLWDSQGILRQTECAGENIPNLMEQCCSICRQMINQTRNPPMECTEQVDTLYTTSCEVNIK